VEEFLLEGLRRGANEEKITRGDGNGGRAHLYRKRGGQDIGGGTLTSKTEEVLWGTDSATSLKARGRKNPSLKGGESEEKSSGIKKNRRGSSCRQKLNRNGRPKGQITSARGGA